MKYKTEAIEEVLKEFFYSEPASGEFVHFKRGDFLFLEGYPVEKVYYIQQGTAKVCIYGDDGKTLLISFCHKDSILGEVETFLDGIAFSTVEAVTDMVCLAIPAKRFYDSAVNDPELLMAVTKTLALRSQCSVYNASLNILNTLESRLCTYIFETSIDDCFSENLSSLCDILGTSYRHLHRTMMKLCEKDILKKHGQNYIIIDRKKLEEASAKQTFKTI